ncbi:hypothetical protein BGX24_008360, partial [Mortierella sp. AD032]
MRSLIKYASLAALASLQALTLLGLMSTTATALTFAEASPVGEEPLEYDGPLSILAEVPYPSATEAEELNITADDGAAQNKRAATPAKSVATSIPIAVLRALHTSVLAYAADTDAPLQKSVHASLSTRLIAA